MSTKNNFIDDKNIKYKYLCRPLLKNKLGCKTV